MNKKELIDILHPWLKKELNQFSFKTIEIHERENFSKTSNKKYKDIRNLANMDFKADLTIILQTESKLEVGIVNCTDKSISLRDIGELQVYCRATNPVFAFMVSSKGFSSEITPFLMDDSITENLFHFSTKSLIGFRLSKEGLDKDSVLPKRYKNNLWQNLT